MHQVKNDLWTPEGNVSLNKDVQAIEKRHVQALSVMHDLSHKVGGIEVRCMRCGSAFQGHNNDTSRTLSIVCRCRELRFTP